MILLSPGAQRSLNIDFGVKMLKKLEERQIQIYIITTIIAIVLGLFINQLTKTTLENLITPALGILMFAMFAQIPFWEIKSSFQHRCFFIILLALNYIAVPILIALLLTIFSPPITLKIGILLVLLTPCIDYVVVFTKLGKGDAKMMLSATPLLFMTQILLLPLYLWCFIGKEVAEIITITPFIHTFATMILIPFFLAMLLQWLASRYQSSTKILNLSAWLPVPFMAIVLFLIISTQIELVLNNHNRHYLLILIPLYASFMSMSFIISYAVGKSAKLPITMTRTLIYSVGTRNSLAVLPFAFALPAEIRTLVAAVIVTQTLVELVGELLFTTITPKL